MSENATPASAANSATQQTTPQTQTESGSAQQTAPSSDIQQNNIAQSPEVSQNPQTNLDNLYAQTEQTPDVPESYDFKDLKQADGSDFNENAIGFATQIGKKMGWSNDQARTFLNEASQIYTQTYNNQMLKMRTDWQNEIRNDPEMGGNNFNQTKANLFTVMSRFGNDGVRDLFNKSGIGDHPEIVRMFNAIGAALSQDNSTIKGEAPKPKKSFKDYYYNTNI